MRMTDEWYNKCDVKHWFGRDQHLHWREMSLTHLQNCILFLRRKAKELEDVGRDRSSFDTTADWMEFYADERRFRMQEAKKLK